MEKYCIIIVSNNKAIIYTVKMLSILDFFDINFTLLFWYMSSIFLHGIYNKYAIKIPAKNGAKMSKNFDITPIISPKLSNNLYTVIMATPSKNQ